MHVGGVIVKLVGMGVLRAAGRGVACGRHKHEDCSNQGRESEL